MNYFNDAKYFGTEIVFCSLCKLHFLFADSHVLPDKKLGLRDSNTLPLGLHPPTYGEHVGIGHSRRCNAFGRMNRVIISLHKFRQNFNISVGNFIFKYLYSLTRFVLWARSTTTHRTSGFLHIWNWIISWRNMYWMCLFINSLPLSVRNQTGRHESSSWNMDRMAEAMDGPLFVLTGTRCRYFENTSISNRTCLWLSLYFALKNFGKISIYF